MTQKTNKYQYIDLLLQVNNDLAVSHSLTQALDTLVNITSSVIGAERGTVFINDSETQELYSRVAQGNLNREIRVMNKQGIAGWVFTNNTGTIVNDAYKDERFHKSVDMRTGYRTKSILCAPLRTVAGEIIGVTQLLNKINDQFTKKDLKLLESITEQATIAIQGHLVQENQPYDLKVYILPVKQANALALPGGPIVIFEGLLYKAESPEELAGVLAHEIQHILLRHSTRGILRNMAESILVTIFLGDMNSVMEGIVQLAGQLETLGLSREMEAEADQKGMELIFSANIDPHGMIRIFEKLMQEESLQKELSEEKTASEENDMKLFSYFSTHPSGRNRLAQLEKQMRSHENRNWTPLFPNLDWNEIKPGN